MEQKDDTQLTGGSRRSATQMQEDAATGANNNEQGQASFVTGSTTGGGSNYGQGSSHLGGESYRQGDKMNTGANYNNEAESLGSSTTGTSDEGSSSPNADAAQSGAAADAPSATGKAGADVDADRLSQDGRDGSSDNNAPDDPGNTGLERDSGLSQDGAATTDRPLSGSWSRSSAEEA